MFTRRLQLGLKLTENLTPINATPDLMATAIHQFGENFGSLRPDLMDDTHGVTSANTNEWPNHFHCGVSKFLAGRAIVRQGSVTRRQEAL